MSRRVGFGMLVGVILIILSGNSQGTTSIMPLGDSITAGVGSPSTGGYRLQLYDLLVGDGYTFDFVGSQSSGSLPDPDNEGHSGFYAEEIRTNITTWLSMNPANIILLHIGTNDIDHEEAPSSVVADVNGILSDIYLVSPSSHVILAKIINQNPYNPKVTTYNSLLDQLLTTWSSVPGFLSIVNMENALNYNEDLYDSIHPNLSGYEKMAAVWYPALINLMATPPAPESVNIDINSITSKTKTISVTVLSAADFYPTSEINRATMVFETNGTEASLPTCARKQWDINADGKLDLACTFSVKNLQFGCGTNIGVLKGANIDGTRFEGIQNFSFSCR